MTIVVSPTTPTVGQTITLSITGQTVAPSLAAHRWQITSKPPLSATALGMLTDEAGAFVDTFVGDAAGAYGVTAYRYALAATAAAGPNDARGTSPLRLEGVETTTVNVYQSVTLPILAKNGHGATLQLGIQDTTIRAAALTSPLSDISRQAAEDASVVAALTAMVGTAIATLGPSIVTGTNELATKYAAHRVLVGGLPVHGVPDTLNTMGRDGANNTEEAIVILALLDQQIHGHLVSASTAGVRWHAVDDTKNVGIAPPATDRASAIVKLCDLRQRVYEPHRVQIASPASHGNADNTNALTAATLLEALIAAFFNFIASASPTAPTGEPAGALAAASLFGFKVT